MPATLWVFGGIAVLVVALLAVDWFTAGRIKGRRLVRARDQNLDKDSVNYGLIERQAQNIHNQTDLPL